MSQAQRKPAAKEPQKVEVIRSPDELKKKALKPGNPSTAAIEAIASAEKAMEDLSVNFVNWMSEESVRLSKARDQAKANKYAASSLDELFHASHDIKGQASTLGYPLAAEICASLCKLLEAAGLGLKLPPQLIDQHVDAVRAMVIEEASGSEHPTAIVLLKALQDVTGDYIAQERSRLLQSKST